MFAAWRWIVARRPARSSNSRQFDRAGRSSVSGRCSAWSTCATFQHDGRDRSQLGGTQPGGFFFPARPLCREPFAQAGSEAPWTLSASIRSSASASNPQVAAVPRPGGSIGRGLPCPQGVASLQRGLLGATPRKLVSHRFTRSRPASSCRGFQPMDASDGEASAAQTLSATATRAASRVAHRAVAWLLLAATNPRLCATDAARQFGGLAPSVRPRPFWRSASSSARGPLRP